jgi:hypothetical protein
MSPLKPGRFEQCWAMRADSVENLRSAGILVEIIVVGARLGIPPVVRL